MRYEVRFVEDSALPSEVEFAFVRLDSRTYLFMKESAVRLPPGECTALTRSFNTWERAQSVALRHLVAV